MAELPAGPVMARQFQTEGVKYLFTLSCGHISPLYDGCLKEGLGVIDFRHPVDPATASWHFAAVGDGHDIAVWAELLGALRAAGYDGDLSIEHEDPRMGPDEGIETSLAGLRAALAHPEVAVG